MLQNNNKSSNTNGETIKTVELTHLIFTEHYVSTRVMEAKTIFISAVHLVAIVP